MPDHMHFGRLYFSIPIYFFNDEFDGGKVNLMAKLQLFSLFQNFSGNPNRDTTMYCY